MSIGNKFSKTLVVGRDRAHVRELCQKYAGEVVSASAFFDKVRLLSFLENKNTRDDHAPMIIAHEILLKNHQSLKDARKYSSLYSSFFHGTHRPKEVLEKVDDHEIRTVLEILSQMDEELLKKSLVNGVTSLYESWLLIKNKKLVPPGLLGVGRIILNHLVDLTLLEIEVIKELSRLGFQFEIRFPMDFLSRGINVAVDFCAKQFEGDADLLNIELTFEDLAKNDVLKPLVESLFTETDITFGAEVSVNHAQDVLTEADEIAGHIADLLQKNPQSKIAVSTRALDQRANIYMRSLARHGLSIKGRKGQVLIESPAGLLLESLLLARINALPKKDLVGLINHQSFRFYEKDLKKRTAILALIEELGVDNRQALSVKDRFAQLERLKLIKNPEAFADLKNILDNFEEILDMLPQISSLANFLIQVLRILELLDQTEPSLTYVKDALSNISKSAALGFDTEISLVDFYSLIKDELKTLTIPSPDNAQANSVEFLLLPELLGRSFDHVFIADITFGRMPQNQVVTLLDDKARIWLNSLMKKPLLRVYFDDPFEPMPVPPRQALEPFWFAAAVASANKSVHFSHALYDELGQEQAPSEFFLWFSNRATSVKSSFSSAEYLRFIEGQKDQQSEIANEQKSALLSRKAAFLDKKTHEFAFLLNRTDLEASFSGRLSKKPTRALTPTMVEAFSSCRFKGYAERILNLNKPNNDQDDVDARVLGQIAHKVLENYFMDKTKIDLSIKLKKIIDEVTSDFCENNFVKNTLVLSCHLDWLFEMLFTLIKRLEEFSLEQNGQIVGQEVDFGLSKAGFSPVKINFDGRHYLLGGRIDRIDKVDEGFLVFDYKLSSSDVLKSFLSPRQMLKSHFQVPIYLRLVSEKFSKNQKVNISLASIKDGKLVFLNDSAGLDKILDDSQPESMAQKIDEIFSPIINGEVLATKGEQCTQCNLSFFCRKNEAEND